MSGEAESAGSLPRPILKTTRFRALLENGIQAREDSILNPSPCSSCSMGCGFIGAECQRTWATAPVRILRKLWGRGPLPDVKNRFCIKFLHCQCKMFMLVPVCIKFMLQKEEKGVEYMLNKQDIEALDAAIRSALVARQEELNMSDEGLGNIAFSYLKAPRGKIQSLFVGQGAPDKRKPQVIKIGELMNLCEAMGLSWTDVIRTGIKNIPK